MGQKKENKPDACKGGPPSIFLAHAFVCGCFGISEKDLDDMLQLKRQNIPDADKHFPKKWSRMLPRRADAKEAQWREVVLTIQREALYDRIVRENGRALFSPTGNITEEVVFSLLNLYRDLLPKLNGNGISKEAFIWVLVENVFVPTVFAQLCQRWRLGLGNEFLEDKCWYLPERTDAELLRPIQRVLEYWFRSSAISTGYRAGHRFVKKTPKETDQVGKKREALIKRFEHWRSGKHLPTLSDLHKFLDEAATEVAWLDDPAAWKTRFTLAFAMQKVCDAMDDFFKNIHKDVSFKLPDMFKQLSEAVVICDENRFLADPRRFFAARLWQIKLKRDGKWEEATALPPAPEQPAPDASDEEIEGSRQNFIWQMNVGNRFLNSIYEMALTDGMPDPHPFAFDDYLFELGVSELNEMLEAKRKEAGKV